MTLTRLVVWARQVVTWLALLCVVSSVQANNSAQFISQDVPAVVYAGMPFEAKLTFKNTGTTTWTSSGSNIQFLGSQNPQDNTIWGTTRIKHPSTNTAPGASAVFTAIFTAPKTAGTYHFQWRPIQSGLGWFGPSSTNLSITVEAPPILDNARLVVGYQGWFNTPGDGYNRNWRHWFNGTQATRPTGAVVDMWPYFDFNEYAVSDLVNTGYKMGTNNSPVYAFSSAKASVVNLHFKWMKDYGIRAAIVGRFASTIINPSDNAKRFRDRVLDNALAAAATHTRYVTIEYDLSGEGNSSWLNSVVADWKWLVDSGRVNNARWLRQGGRPVIRIYGLGFVGRNESYFTAQQAKDFLDQFTGNYDAYIIGGVPSYWRTNSNDARSDGDWRGVYTRLDMLAPWTVGRYNDNTTVQNWAANRVKPDLVELVKIRNATGKRIGYLPYVFPGFSWSNLQRDNNPRPLYNNIPRHGGNFFWKQVYEYLSLGNQMLGIAMFDEVDEGTAIFKVANSDNLSPKDVNAGNDYFMHLSQGDSSFATRAQAVYGTAYPTDWYLRLAKQASLYLYGTNTAPLTETRPINP